MLEQTREQAQDLGARELGLAAASWPSLGTTARLVVTDPDALAAARATVEHQLAHIDVALSRFRPDSELEKLNTAEGRWLQVSPLFVQAMRVAIDAASWTNGLVDPTVGAALIALGYDRTFARVALDGPPVSIQPGRVSGWHHIELDDEAARVRIPPGVRVDLGATAKALASDLCANAVANAFDCGVLVSLGGDIAVAGAGPTAGWPITVTDLSDMSLPISGAGQVIALAGGGLATSSTRARRWRRGGSQLHHLIDPSSGLPADGPWRTVSVSAQTCVRANTASTAAIILGAAAPTWLRDRGFSSRLARTDGTVIHLGGWPTEGEQS